MRKWLAPAAAALCVLAVGLSLVLTRTTPHNSPPVLTAASRPAPASGVPSYYATIYQPDKSSSLLDIVVGDTRTGARVSLIKPPAGMTFVGVSESGDDRTFAVEASALSHTTNFSLPLTWYLLRITPGTSSPVRLTRLPIPAMEPFTVQGIALSGSGRELAMILQPSGPADEVLRIYSVTTGRLLRSWSKAGTAFFGSPLPPLLQAGELSWTDNDRALAFIAGNAVPQKSTPVYTQFETVRVLNVSASGGSLAADSRQVWSAECEVPQGTFGLGACDSGRLTANGRAVVWPSVTYQVPAGSGRTVHPGPAADVPGPGTGAARPGTAASTARVPVTVEWLADSVAPASGTHVLGRIVTSMPASALPPANQILWVSASGGALITDWSVASSATSSGDHFGVLSGGRFTALPALPANAWLSQIAW